MIQAYSTSAFPAIPVLDVSFAFPESADWKGPYPAIVDSGADFTVVPIALLRPLDLPVVRPVTLSSLWQDKRAAYMYEVDLRIGDLVLPAVDVAGDRVGGQILLGRNVLNKLDLRLEGPAQRTHIL
ncbi:MAG: retropepsin-like domain-containing protein [Anaerolineales bacterium]|nr:retropepsin-like domain-containing protein [Anaerolineales bacterium]